MKFNCPHCKKPTISLQQKYLAGKWLDIYCKECSGRICAQPILLAILYFFYTWDVMLFGYVAILKHSWMYVGILIAGWITLDLFNLTLPLSRMRPKAGQKPNSGSTPKT